MKYTLLELVQDVSSSIDSDEVNSISDSAESLQIVAIIKSVLDDMVSRGDLGDQKTMFNLVPSGDNTKPVLMYKPDNIDRIDWIKYNKLGVDDTDPSWSEVYYLSPEVFIDYVSNYSPSETDVDTFTLASSGFTFTIPYKNNTAPSHYTSFDNNTIIFDGYDSAVDTTLQSSKTICFGKLKLNWEQLDTYVPPIQSEQFPLLLSEAKSRAWAELRQSPNQKIEQGARRGWVHLQKTRTVTPSGTKTTRGHNVDSYPNFSRRR